MVEKLRILVVDDSKVVRRAFTRILADEYDLVEAVNGEAAWEILQKDADICAVFSDINMPILDGHGLLARIRKSEDEEIKGLPVVLVTAAADGVDTTKQALSAGATDYVLKPFDSVFLHSKAKAHVKPRDKVLGDNRVATLDPLTRLANKTYFQVRGAQAMSAANRHKSELTLLEVSIDKFVELSGQIDSKFMKGIIRKLGSYLLSEVRHEDTVARIDKDRFAILLNEASLGGARELAERLRQRVRQKAIRHDGQAFNITVSIGISALPPEVNRTFEMLQLDAERHLREAAAQGGDRVLPAKIVAAEPREKGGGIIPSLDSAMAMLNRREEKLSPEQTRDVIRHLLPLLDYCDKILNLELGDELEKLKSKYG